MCVYGYCRIGTRQQSIDRQARNIKKKESAIEQIRKYSRDFDGTLKDTEVMKLVGLARNTYYSY